MNSVTIDTRHSLEAVVITVESRLHITVSVLTTIIVVKKENLYMLKLLLMEITNVMI
jgi:hypothetical protein